MTRSTRMIGLGCMGLSGLLESGCKDQAVRVIRHAITTGVNFLDTADVYGFGHNELLVGEAIKKFPRDEVIVCTKGGVDWVPEGTIGLDGTPQSLKDACEASLKRLGVDYIDVYYLHKPDPNVPVEESWGALCDLTAEGKIKMAGISNPKRLHTLRFGPRAIQQEFSMWTMPEDFALVADRRTIYPVAYSPLGRGLAAFKYLYPSSLPEDDFRRKSPNFPADFQKLIDTVPPLYELARSLDITLPQLALAWIWKVDPFIVPIPSASGCIRVDENAAARNIKLSDEIYSKIREILDAAGK